MKKLGTVLLCLTAALAMAACNIVTPADGNFRREIQGDVRESLNEAREDMREAIDGVRDDAREALEDLRDEDSGKRHYYEVLDSQGKTLYTIDSGKGVEAVDDVLEEPLEGLEALSAEAGEPLYTYVFWQERTLLAGEDPAAERGYQALLRCAVPAEGNVLGVEVTLPEEADPPEWLELDGLLSFGVELSDGAMEALRDPAQFAEE